MPDLNKTVAGSDSRPVDAPRPQPSQPPAPQLHVDDSQAASLYANFCRITGTPEELIIDFGLNPQPFGVPTEPIKVSQRIVTNFYTAKRLLYALQMSIQRHEAAFGVLEIDVNKRVNPALLRASAPPAQQPS